MIKDHQQGLAVDNTDKLPTVATTFAPHMLDQHRHGVQFPVAEAKLMFDQTWLIKSQGQFLAFTVANGMDRYIYI